MQERRHANNTATSLQRDQEDVEDPEDHGGDFRSALKKSTSDPNLRGGGGISGSSKMSVLASVQRAGELIFVRVFRRRLHVLVFSCLMGMTAIAVIHHIVQNQKKKALPPFFAGCLLTMDDNHRLPEWLAYHYHMLPLRHLVVMVDPRSRTSPTPIFDRWREHSDMIIEQWNGTEAHWKEHVPVDPNKEDDPKHLRESHIKRQRLFYGGCIKHLQEQYMNKQEQLWTVFWDTDEFLFLNYNTIPASHKLARHPGAVSAFLQKHPIQEWGEGQKSAIDIETPLHLQTLYRPCTVVPRVTVSSVDSKEFQNITNSLNHTEPLHLPPWIEGDKFETLRWRYYDSETHHLISSSFGKSIVDVLHPATVKYLEEDHHIATNRVTLRNCPWPPRRASSSFVVHHYIGSWEVYSARKGDSRQGTLEYSRTAWEKLSKYPDEVLDRDVQKAWVEGFVDSVGESTAQLLLTGAGVVVNRR